MSEPTGRDRTWTDDDEDRAAGMLALILDRGPFADIRLTDNGKRDLIAHALAEERRDARGGGRNAPSIVPLRRRVEAAHAIADALGGCYRHGGAGRVTRVAREYGVDPHNVERTIHSALRALSARVADLEGAKSP